MRRFQAPDHVTALVCFAGEFRADENGVLKVADDAPEGLFPILAANGWAELPAAPEKSKSGDKAD
jgi:hypothetical protein